MNAHSPLRAVALSLTLALCGCGAPQTSPSSAETQPEAEAEAPAEPTDTLRVRVGGDWNETLSELARFGAKETEIAIAPAEGERCVAYALPDGRLLVLAGKGDVISRLEECWNADASKADQEWANVEEVAYRALH